MGVADKALPAMMPAIVKALGVDPEQLNGAIQKVAGIACQMDARLTAIENQLIALTYATNNLVQRTVENDSRERGNGNPSCGSCGNRGASGSTASGSGSYGSDSGSERGSGDSGSGSANGGSAEQTIGD